eukprot:15476780-Alexandrium_andersonii.AAC.1
MFSHAREAHARAYTNTHALLRACVPSRPPARTHARTHARMHTQTSAQTQTDTDADTDTETKTDADADADTDTDTDTDTSTDTHTHTFPPQAHLRSGCSESLSCRTAQLPCKAARSERGHTGARRPVRESTKPSATRRSSREAGATSGRCSRRLLRRRRRRPGSRHTAAEGRGCGPPLRARSPRSARWATPRRCRRRCSQGATRGAH